MESKFYQADEHRAERVQELFAKIARRYDWLNDVMSAGLHRHWKRRLAELARGEKAPEAGTGKGKEVLDLCCGTGDIALRFARQGARVTGVDFTAEMLQVAKARAWRGSARTPNAPVAARKSEKDSRPRKHSGRGPARRGAPACADEAASARRRPGPDIGIPMSESGQVGVNSRALPTTQNGPATCGLGWGQPTLHRPYQGDVTWVRADALRLPFRDNSFDVVSVGYGLRNLADIEQGLREILRVLRPGGKLLSLDFGKPEAKAFRRLYFGYLQTVLPMLGRIFCGDPDTHGYILASLPDYPAQRGIRELMESIGYGECGFEEFCLGAMAVNYGMKPAR